MDVSPRISVREKRRARFVHCRAVAERIRRSDRPLRAINPRGFAPPLAPTHFCGIHTAGVSHHTHVSLSLLFRRTYPSEIRWRGIERWRGRTLHSSYLVARPPASLPPPHHYLLHPAARSAVRGHRSPPPSRDSHHPSYSRVE